MQTRAPSEMKVPAQRKTQASKTIRNTLSRNRNRIQGSAALSVVNMNVIQRVRASGKCPPSLLRESPQENDFENAVARVLDPNDLALAVGGQLGADFDALMQMATSTVNIPGDPATQKALLTQRRCVILTIVGSTPPSSSSIPIILKSGFLSSVKTWLDEAMNGTVGGIDLLLHLLTNVTELPVTKSIVKESGMGKVIGSIEKHKICIGSPNENAIKERVKKIKDAWNKSVKALKEKRHDPPPASPPSPKRARIEETKKSTFSSLLSKVKPESNGDEAAQASIPKKTPSQHETSTISFESTVKHSNVTKNVEKKKQAKRVKWEDHFGGKLEEAKIIEGGELRGDTPAGGDAADSWSDRKRRDRLREKELLAKVKKSKLMDDDDDSIPMERAPPRAAIQPSTPWRAPAPLPVRADAPPPQVDSKEVAAQTTRMTSVTKAHYTSDYSVPNSPAPMSDVEQALDMTNQSSTVTQSIPFFVPQQVPAPAPTPAAPAPAGYGDPSASAWGTAQNQSSLLGGSSNIATPEFVQSLGLPPFLAGQDVQALQTLASTPSLLSTFVDSNGMYDQGRLTSLVQTLSQNSTPSASMGNSGYQQNSYGSGQQAFGSSGAGGIYGPASGGSTYGASSNGSFGTGGWQPKPSHQSNSDGNLHISGYGPTTSQAEIIALFSPYVRVDEVVMKGNFSFVNTSDPLGAKRAREALAGAMLGGAPIRINTAQRKKRDDTFGSTSTSFFGGAGQAMNQSFSQPAAPGLGATGDANNVRDDRGNPATKNLFVAGYGPGTSEHQLKEVFSQHAQIVGIIMKNSFSFVNTSDRNAAIRAREVLSGSMLNGGVLRINFAKETGRLGTSFDVTYNNAGGGAGAGAGGHSHYGRGF